MWRVSGASGRVRMSVLGTPRNGCTAVAVCAGIGGGGGGCVKIRPGGAGLRPVCGIAGTGAGGCARGGEGVCVKCTDHSHCFNGCVLLESTRLCSSAVWHAAADAAVLWRQQQHWLHCWRRAQRCCCLRCRCERVHHLITLQRGLADGPSCCDRMHCIRQPLTAVGALRLLLHLYSCRLSGA